MAAAADNAVIVLEDANDNKLTPDEEYNSVIEEFNKFDKNHDMFGQLCKYMKVLMSVHNAAVHVRVANELIQNASKNQNHYDPSIAGISMNSNHQICIGARVIRPPTTAAPSQPVVAGVMVPPNVNLTRVNALVNAAIQQQNNDTAVAAPKLPAKRQRQI